MRPGRVRPAIGLLLNATDHHCSSGRVKVLVEVGSRRWGGGDSGGGGRRRRRRCELSLARGQVGVVCSTARCRVPPRSSDVWTQHGPRPPRDRRIPGRIELRGFRNSGPLALAASSRRSPHTSHARILSGPQVWAAIPIPPTSSLFAWLISHQSAVLFSQNKSATSNQPAVLFSQNKPAPAISHQPTEQACSRCTFSFQSLVMVFLLVFLE
jgi:hypothetical protein